MHARAGCGWMTFDTRRKAIDETWLSHFLASQTKLSIAFLERVANFDNETCLQVLQYATGCCQQLRLPKSCMRKEVLASTLKSLMVGWNNRAKEFADADCLSPAGGFDWQKAGVYSIVFEDDKGQLGETVAFWKRTICHTTKHVHTRMNAFGRVPVIVLPERNGVSRLTGKSIKHNPSGDIETIPAHITITKAFAIARNWSDHDASLVYQTVEYNVKSTFFKTSHGGNLVEKLPKASVVLSSKLSQQLR